MKQNDIEKTILVQKHQLDRASDKLSELDIQLMNVSDTEKGNRNALEALDAKMAQILKKCGIDRNQLNLEDIRSKVELDDSELAEIEKRLYQFGPLEIIEFTDWEDYRKKVDSYINKYQLDMSVDPLRQMLSSAQIAQIEKEYNQTFGTVKWNEWDWGIVVLSAICAMLIDYFVVRIPKTETFLGKDYKGSQLTRWLREINQKDEQEVRKPKGQDEDRKFENWLKKNGKLLKVPYDAPNKRSLNDNEIKGLNSHHHRLMTPGHDPVLGFIVGVIDIMKARMTVIDQYGKLHFLDRSDKFDQTNNIFLAFVKVFAHLLSDVSTSCGIQPPFFTLLQLINGKSPFILKEDGERVSYTDVARYMYKHGYTMEHFLTMSLVPLIIGVTIHTYYRIANFDMLYKNPHRVVNKDVKLCSMLTLAHNLSMSGNVIKMWMYGWNPSAFNWSELLMLVKSFYSLYKATQERNKAIEDHLYNEWTQLYNFSSYAFRKNDRTYLLI